MEAKNSLYMITNINKLGGVKSEILPLLRCDVKRFSALFSVPKAAIFVSLLCMGMALLTLTACSEDDASPIENNLDTETAESIDSTDTSHAVISDWEEGKAGKLVPVDNPEEGNLNNAEGGAV